MGDELSDLEPVETVSTPRLSIFHLLLSTGAIALMLTLSRVVVEDDPGAQWYELLTYVIAATSCGLGLAGAALLVSRWKRGQSGPLQPGEWLLLILATEGLTFFAVGLLWRLHPDSDASETLVNLLWSGGGAATAILAAWFCRHMPAWRWLFGSSGRLDNRLPCYCCLAVRARRHYLVADLR